MRAVVALLTLAVILLSASASLPQHPAIFGGTLAKSGQFKFVVDVVIKEGDNVGTCTGFILDAFHIGLAAHCVTSTSQIRIIYNDININDGNTTNVAVAQVLAIHPLYDDTTLVYDSAVLRLNNPLTLGDSLAAIPLATSLPKTGETVYSAGYGKVEDDSSGVLEFVAIPLTDFDDCNKYIEEHNSAGTGLLEGNQICAGKEGSGICQGDSGSALFTTSDINNPTDAKAIGITSFTFGGCGSGYAGYASIPGFAGEWIAEQIRRDPKCRSNCAKLARTCKGSQRYCRQVKGGCYRTCSLI